MHILWLDLVRTAFGAAISFMVGVALTWWWQQRLVRRTRDRYERHSRERGVCAAALCVSVRDDISQPVRVYLDRNELADVPLSRVHQAEGFDLTGEDWLPFLERVKKELRAVREFGATRIYLFTNVPVAVAIFLGATLANGPEVVVHHFASGAYTPVGRVAFETVKL